MANGSKVSRMLGVILLLISAGILIWLAKGRMQSSSSEGGADIPIGRRPVVLVTVDTTRADHLQPYGAKDIATPTFLRLAQEGITFEQAYSVAPITLVAHTSIMTGLYPFEHGVRNNGIQYVPEEVETLAEQLRSEGYRTGAFVSAAVLERRYGLAQGFEVYDDDLSTGRNRRPRMVADRPAEAVVEAASGWLETLDDDEPYFLWAHFYDPHAMYSPPAPYRDRYRERLYDGEIAYMDAQIGQLLEHPRLKGGQEPIVVVIGDHGESLGEHNERTHAMLAYDSTLHVPFLLKVPGGPQGTRVPGNVSQVDVVPTLLALLGLKPGGEILGKSLLPVIAGKSGGNRALYSETYLPFYTYGWSKLRVLRQGRWKFIDAPTPELYNLKADPSELTNVHDREPGYSHDLTRDLTELLGTVEDSEHEAALSLDSESEEKLRSLGYLSTGSGNKDTGPRPDPKEVIGLHVNLELARQLLQDRLFDRAETQLRKVLEQDPENLAALVDLVQALEGQNKVEAAIRTAERALEIDPDYTRMFVVLARLEANRGELDKSLELAQLAMDKDPKNPEFLLVKARLMARAGRQDEVEKLLTRGIEDFSEIPKISVAYAQLIEVRRGELESAETRLREAVEHDPFNALGWVVLGRVLERTGRAEEAIDTYRRGLESDSSNMDLHGSLGTLLVSRGALTEGIQHLKEAVRLSPRMQPSLHVSLGGALAELGQLEAAGKEYERVLAVQPKHPGARNNYAVALRRHGRIEQAEKLLMELIADSPKNVDAYNNLSAIAVDKEEWSKAERYARIALDLDGTLPEVWNNLAIAQEEQGRSEESERSYTRALELDPEYWPSHLNLGILYRKIGRSSEALTALGEALSRVPQLPAAHYELGMLYAGPMSDPAKARNHFNAFLKYSQEKDSRTVEVRKMLENLTVTGP